MYAKSICISIEIKFLKLKLKNCIPFDSLPDMAFCAQHNWALNIYCFLCIAKLDLKYIFLLFVHSKTGLEIYIFAFCT